MSPEIIIGDEFDLETDIFSLGRSQYKLSAVQDSDMPYLEGIIFCEISSRKLVDDFTFKRIMPSFGLDAAEVRQLASPGCPPAYVELAIACVATEPSERPSIRTILEQLVSIERGVIEATAGIGYNVGSLTFGAKFAGRQNKNSRFKRPQPGRIPSFDGQISSSLHFEDAKDENSSSDEDVEETLAKLEKLQVGGKGMIYLNAGSAQGTSRLLEGNNEDRNEAYSVVKGSKMLMRSRLVEQDGTTSSTVTVKAAPPVSSFSQSSSSLPSLPASWLEAVKPAEEISALASDLESKDLQASAVAISGHSSVAPDLQEPEFSTAMPGSLAASKFATIRSLSMPVPATLEWINVSALTTSGQPSPHRFTLIKPGWKALWDSSINPETKPYKRLSSSSDGSKRVSTPASNNRDAVRGSSEAQKPSNIGNLAAMLPMQLLGTGLLTRCRMCEKRLGLMKPYLACDDCQRV